MDLMSTLKAKWHGIPVWVMALMGVAGLAWYMKRKKATTAPSAATAANQANTNLGSASQLQNMFTTAGLMPFQGGNTYVNTAAPAAPAQPVVVNAGHNQTLGSIVQWAQQNGYPNFTWADLWALNPGLINGQTIAPGSSGEWYLTGWSTPITISKPGTLQVGASSGSISADNTKPV